MNNVYSCDKAIARGIQLCGKTHIFPFVPFKFDRTACKISANKYTCKCSSSRPNYFLQARVGARVLVVGSTNGKIENGGRYVDVVICTRAADTRIRIRSRTY